MTFAADLAARQSRVGPACAVLRVFRVYPCHTPVNKGHELFGTEHPHLNLTGHSRAGIPYRPITHTLARLYGIFLANHRKGNEAAPGNDNKRSVAAYDGPRRIPLSGQTDTRAIVQSKTSSDCLTAAVLSIDNPSVECYPARTSSLCAWRKKLEVRLSSVRYQ